MGQRERRVLAVLAHPDDSEIYVSGTLAKFIASGAEVTVAIACRGDRGGSVSPEELALLRKNEASRSARLLGAAIDFLELGDGSLQDDPFHQDVFLRLIRRTRPTLVLTHSPTDYHLDHVRVSQLVQTATWVCANAGVPTPEPAMDRLPGLFFCDNLAGIEFLPTHWVDVSDFGDLKQRMFSCHQSQIARSRDGKHRLEQTSEVLARLRGAQCGVELAEAFRHAGLYGRQVPEPVFP